MKKYYVVTDSLTTVNGISILMFYGPKHLLEKDRRNFFVSDSIDEALSKAESLLKFRIKNLKDNLFTIQKGWRHESK